DIKKYLLNTQAALPYSRRGKDSLSSIARRGRRFERVLTDRLFLSESRFKPADRSYDECLQHSWAAQRLHFLHPEQFIAMRLTAEKRAPLNLVHVFLGRVGRSRMSGVWGDKGSGRCT
ncbi:hypothetical protein LOAG_12984, partial [Loa loa]